MHALLRREKRQHLFGYSRWQLIKQMGAVIGRHVVEKSGDIILRHRFEQQFLRGEVEVFEDVGGKSARQNTKDDHLILNRQTDNQARQVCGLPILELPRAMRRSRARE